MQKISTKNLILFAVVVAFAATAFGVIIYSGARLFFMKTPVGEKAPVAQKSADCKSYRALDGVCLTGDAKELYPVAVMIDNKEEARPWAGVSSAGLVFEAPVEGGITRFLAIFTTDEAIKKIGPVRSIRPYCIDWAREFGAIMMHIGGSPDALKIIAGDSGLSGRNIDGAGDYFWRDNSRIAPHNAYTSSALLDKARKKFGLADLKFDQWTFKDDDMISERGTAGLLIVKFNNYAQYDAVWEYDRDKNEYKRKIGKKYAQDEDGRMILAKNVAILQTDIEVIDAVSRRKITTVGAGDALLFQDGKKIEARWEKRSQDDRIAFFDLNGKELKFNRGATWIEVVSDLTSVSESDTK
jgi:hypothetical protein